MAGTLKWKIDEKLKQIVAHTMAATEWKTAYRPEPYKEASLFFVKDSGVYLMTAAKEGQDDPEKKGSCLVAYAEGLDPKTNPDYYDDQRAICGGDDFAENVECKPIADAIAQGAEYIKIRLTKKTMRLIVGPGKTPIAAH